MLDILIRGGQIVDGSGASSYTADVGVEGNRIVGVGKLGSPLARRVVDADGMVVAPGFIDMHTHSDFTILLNPKAESNVRQGVTTEVMGNCGYSPAPVNPATFADLEAYTRPLGPGLPWDWSTFGEYLDRVRQQGTALNLVPLVGQGAVRIAVMGFSDRAPGGAEMEAMRALVAQAMQEGAWGLSTGLIYPPGCYAETEEIVEMARVAARHHGFYASHIRQESEGLLESVDEAIAIGQRAGLRVEISHFKSAGTANWGRIGQAAQRLEDARSRGLVASADFYPYLAGSTFLNALLPPWSLAGGVRELLARLRQPEPRARLRHEIDEATPSWWNPIRTIGGWDKVLIVSTQSPANRYCQGLTVTELARRQGKDPYDTVFDLLLEDGGGVMVVIFMMSEDDVRWLLRYPGAALGSDSAVSAPYGELARGQVHPRTYGAFARVLGHYVREEKVLSLPEAVRKMTGLPASFLGLRDRGLIKDGLAADLVVFDPTRVADRATYADPHRYAEGVEWVLVNGQTVVEKGEHTGALAGEVLRRPGPRSEP